MLTLKFVHARKGPSNDGRGLIQLRIYVSGRPAKYHSTGYYVKPEQWDDKNQVVRGHSDSININVTLSGKKLKAFSYYAQAESLGVSPTAADVKAHLEQSSQTVTDYIISQIKNRTDLEDSSKVTHRLLVTYLNEFKPGLRFAQLNRPFISAFEKWLLSQKKKKGHGRLGRNYVSNLIDFFKAYIALAVEDEKIKENPFIAYTVKRFKSKRLYLTKEEVGAISNLFDSNELPPAQHRETRRFLFACFTGLRISDTKLLQVKHLYRTEKGLRLRKTPRKTRKKGTEIDLPLYAMFSGRPETLIMPLLGGKHDEEFVFGGYDTSNYNTLIKLVAKKAGIKKNISSHTARHTCAMALLNDGIDLHALSKILGHNSIRTTQVYAELLTSTVDERLEKTYMNDREIE